MLENVGDFYSNPSKTLSRTRERTTTRPSSQRVNTCRTSRRGSPASPREPCKSCPLSSQPEQLRALRRTTPERSAPRDTCPSSRPTGGEVPPTRGGRGTPARHCSYFSRNPLPELVKISIPTISLNTRRSFLSSDAGKCSGAYMQGYPAPYLLPRVHPARERQRAPRSERGLQNSDRDSAARPALPKLSMTGRIVHPSAQRRLLPLSPRRRTQAAQEKGSALSVVKLYHRGRGGKNGTF